MNSSGSIRDLKGTIEREHAEIGLIITLDEPSKPMLLEASSAGAYTSPILGKDYPRIQILTIRELLEEHTKPMLPLLLMPTCQQTERIPAKQAAELESTAYLGDASKPLLKFAMDCMRYASEEHPG